MYKAVTRGIRVAVLPRFVEEESSPDDGRYFFAYTVEITNMSTDRVQLQSRHWKIVDGHGNLQEVRGPGVVGKQPVLGPGETFSYTSGCPLTTPNGTMEGTYTMVTGKGETFHADIPAFSLDSPFTKRVMHYEAMAGVRYTPLEMLARLVAFDTESAKSNLPLIDFVEDYLKGWDVPHIRVAERGGRQGGDLRDARAGGPRRRRALRPHRRRAGDGAVLDERPLHASGRERARLWPRRRRHEGLRRARAGARPRSPRHGSEDADPHPPVL